MIIAPGDVLTWVMAKEDRLFMSCYNMYHHHWEANPTGAYSHIHSSFSTYKGLMASCQAGLQPISTSSWQDWSVCSGHDFLGHLTGLLHPELYVCIFYALLYKILMPTHHIPWSTACVRMGHIMLLLVVILYKRDDI